MYRARRRSSGGTSARNDRWKSEQGTGAGGAPRCAAAQVGVVGDPGAEKLSRRGLSAFLAEHENCGGGFEVQRREDSAGSIVRVICGGCRQSIEYSAASDEDLIVDQPASREDKASATNATPAKKGEPRRSDSGAGSINWRTWLPGLIAGLVGGALVLIVIAIASGGGSDHCIEFRWRLGELEHPRRAGRQARRPPRLRHRRRSGNQSRRMTRPGSTSGDSPIACPSAFREAGAPGWTGEP